MQAQIVAADAPPGPLTDASSPEVDGLTASLEVVGVGLGRTGTTSLEQALGVLGFRCYDSESRGIDADLGTWLDAASGKPVDWDRILEDCNAMVEPAAFVWREIRDRFPAAKVVLTVRDPSEWYASYRDGIVPLISDMSMIRHADTRRRMEILRYLILEKTFHGRFDDEDYAKAVFCRHNESVMSAVPSKQLLVMEAGAGWEPLCDFLGQPVPEDPYPRLNDNRTVREQLWIARGSSDF